MEEAPVAGIWRVAGAPSAWRAIAQTGGSLPACLAGTYLLRVAANASGFYIGMIVAHLAAGDVGLGAREVGLLAAAFYGAELVGAPFFGSLADRRGYRLFLVLGPLFGLAGLALMPLTTTRVHGAVLLLAMLLLVRVLEGLSTAASAPSTLGYLAAETASMPALRARVMGFYEVVTLLGIFSGPPIAGLVWRAAGGQGWQFWVVGGIYLAATAAYALVGASQTHKVAEAQPRSRTWLKQRALWSFVPAWLGVNAILGAWGSQIVYMLARSDDPSQLLVGGFGSAQIGLMVGAFGATFTLGAVVWSFALARVGRVRVMRLAMGGALTTSAALYWVNHSAPGSAWLWLGVGLLLLGVLVMSGFTPAALTYLADLSEHTPEHRGATMGIYSVLLGLGQLLGGLLGGSFAGGLGPLGRAIGLGRLGEQGLGADGLILLTLLLTAMVIAAVVRLREAR